MIPRRFFLLCAVIALAFSGLPLHAQDDAYAHVRFTNETEQAVKLKVWNPRVERPPFEATVEAGKSVTLADKGGKPLLVGLGSSYIQVEGEKPQSVITVAARNDDIYAIVWTKGGFKVKAKAKE